MGRRQCERGPSAQVQALRRRRVRVLVEGSSSDGASADAERTEVEAGVESSKKLVGAGRSGSGVEGLGARNVWDGASGPSSSLRSGWSKVR